MILCAIAGYMSDDRLCYPKLKTIARYSGLSLRNVKKHLSDMCWTDEKTTALRAQGFTDEQIAARAAKCELLKRHEYTALGDHDSNWYYLRPYPKEPLDDTDANGNGKRRARRTT